MTLTVRWKPLLVLVAIGFLAYGGYYYWDTQIKIIPEELWGRTMARLGQLESYRYKVELRLMTGGHERYISSVEGERAGIDAFYLKGTIEGTEIEAYHLDRNTYLKTGNDEKWMTIPGNEVFEQDLFMVEIDPLASFKFYNVNALSYEGTITMEQQKLHIMTCRPEVDHPFMTKHWSDFEYILFVKRNGELVKAEVKASLKARPTDTMTMVIELRDYNAKIQLSPPVQ